MILLAAVLLAGSTIEEAEHALQAGRVGQTEQMIRQMVEAGESGERIDRLRAGSAYAAGRYAESLAIFSRLGGQNPGDPYLSEGAARAALRLGKVADARRWSSLSTSRPNAGWKAWNLCGAIADVEGDFQRADDCYAKAKTLAPGRVENLNNHGWSKLLRGEWKVAADLFRQALAADSGNVIAKSNLELAQAALANDLPVRRKGELDGEYAARLNDAGVVAEAAGDRQRAVAAFANALSLRSAWSAKTARNLADAEGR